MLSVLTAHIIVTTTIVAIIKRQEETLEGDGHVYGLGKLTPRLIEVYMLNTLNYMPITPPWSVSEKIRDWGVGPQWGQGWVSRQEHLEGIVGTKGLQTGEKSPGQRGSGWPRVASCPLSMSLQGALPHGAMPSYSCTFWEVSQGWAVRREAGPCWALSGPAQQVSRAAFSHCGWPFPRCSSNQLEEFSSIFQKEIREQNTLE